MGGKPGGLREHRIDGKTVDPMDTHRLDPGQRLTLIEAGGGGFGDPAKRDPAKVRADVEQGFVTPEGARRDYGVEIETGRD